MRSVPDTVKVEEVLKLKAKQMLVVNAEYQRGAVWTTAQKKRLVDSVLRGYTIPLIYLHRIKQEAGGLVSQRYEVIDGQQRITALYEYHEGAFKVFDPVNDAAEARFPEFIKRQPCPWGGLTFKDLPDELKEKFLTTDLGIVRIETDEQGEPRDLFVRLQAGMPLNPQEKRDAWPGQFTDFVLRLAGKPGIARYPGHSFFTQLMGAKRALTDRGRFRQYAAQVAMLYLTRRRTGGESFCDTKAEAIDDFYYENLDFDASSPDARRLEQIVEKLYRLLGDEKRKKILAHEAIHLVLLVDSLWDDYTRSWEAQLANAFDSFRAELARATKTKDAPQPGEYWLRYGLYARSGADRADSIQRRHEFFATKMRELLNPQPKDPNRLFGPLEREIIYYRDQKRCAVDDAEVVWQEADIHHVEPHATGGRTSLDNGALVHRHCHPKGAEAVAEFARRWRARKGDPSQNEQAGPDAPELE